MAAYASIPKPCEVCGTIMMVQPCKLSRKRYCSRPCAFIGQGRRRRVWNKGLTKADHPSLQRVSDAVRQNYIDNPDRGRGKNHPFYGKTHTPEVVEKLRQSRAQQPVTPAMLEALRAGRFDPTGLTNETSEVLRQRNAKGGLTRRGRKSPAHSAWLKQFYQAHPEKHPNHLVAKHGHETKPERLMRQTLTSHGLIFERQFRIGSLWIDFALPQAKLAIEVDGEYWHDPIRDAKRDKRLKRLKWHVLHFTEAQVETELSTCLQRILDEVTTLNHGQYPLLGDRQDLT